MYSLTQRKRARNFERVAKYIETQDKNGFIILYVPSLFETVLFQFTAVVATATLSLCVNSLIQYTLNRSFLQADRTGWTATVSDSVRSFNHFEWFFETFFPLSLSLSRNIMLHIFFNSSSFEKKKTFLNWLLILTKEMERKKEKTHSTHRNENIQL